MSFSLLDYDLLEVRNFIFTLSQGAELHLKHGECVHPCSVLSDSANPWTVTCQTPSSVEFSKQEHWSVAISFSRESSWARDWTWISCIGRQILYHCTTWEALETLVQFSSITRSCLTLQPHGVQHTRPPCPSATPVVYSNSCPLNWWCHPTISSSVVPFCSCLHSFPASESFQMSQFFSSGGQSFSFNISPFSEYSGLILFRMDWLDLLAVQGTLLNNYQLMIAKCSLNYRQM